ncbi:MAG: hypothetical protein IJU50_05525, partial [Lachnospiraceae bacterium]|nr:hypothetical protein [Lachnospiraceae bacterium]
LHYLDKGGVLPTWELPRETSFPEAVALLLEAFALPAVNTFILISGYFAVKSGYRIEDNPKKPVSKQFLKLASLWGLVFFYSVGVSGFIFLLNFLKGTVLGVSARSKLDLYYIIERIFPVLTNQYWFVTSYLLLSIAAVFIKPCIGKIDQQTFLIGLGLLLGYFSIAKSFLFFYQLPLDDGGYGPLWFLVLFLTGAYLARFGLPFTGEKKKARFGLSFTGGKRKARFGLSFTGRKRKARLFFGILYGGSAILIWVLTLSLRAIALHTMHFAQVTDYAYTYNHILTFLSALGLFLFFLTFTDDCFIFKIQSLTDEPCENAVAKQPLPNVSSEHLPEANSKSASLFGSIRMLRGGSAVETVSQDGKEDAGKALEECGRGNVSGQNRTGKVFEQNGLGKVLTWFERGVLLVSPSVFSVYLVHEHPDLRYAWPVWFHTGKYASSLLWIPHWFLTITAVYVSCLLIDFCRRGILFLLKRKYEKSN